MDTAQALWWLAAQVPPTLPGREAGFVNVRELSAEEAERARESGRFLTRLADATGYAQIVEAFRALEEASKQKSSPERLVLDMNASVRALGVVAADLPGSLRESAARDFDADSEQSAKIEAAIGEESSKPPFRLLVALGSLGSGPYAIAIQGENLVLEPEALAQLSNEVAGVGPGLNLLATARTGVVVAQRLVGRQLQIYAPLINDHSRLIRQLAAEVPYGNACLIRQRPVSVEGDQPGRTTLDLEELPLDRGVLLHQASALTGQLLNTTSTLRLLTANPSPAGSQGPTTAPIPEGPLEGAAETKSAPDTADVDGQVLDLPALAQHATDFADELERAWSAAMDAALLADAQVETQARYSALLTAIGRRAEATDQALRDAGTAPGLLGVRLPTHEVARLSFDADQERALLQTRSAEMAALEHLLQAVRAMRAPSAGRRFSSCLETWWEAGAFSLVRDRAALLVRLRDDVSALMTEVSAGLGGGPSMAADLIGSAANAYSHGDVHATLMHVRLALFETAAAERESVPGDLLERLARYTSRIEDAAALRLVEESARLTSAGVVPDTGTATLLAPVALAAAQRLIQLPQVFEDALKDGDPDA